MAAKRSPNSLCVRLQNWKDVCANLQGTMWEVDLTRGSSAAGLNGHEQSHGGRSSSPVSDACTCEAGSAGLVLGGSHHKTGTVLLERLLGMYAARARVPLL